jgi:hypothetical protein
MVRFGRRFGVVPGVAHITCGLMTDSRGGAFDEVPVQSIRCTFKPTACKRLIACCGLFIEVIQGNQMQVIDKQQMLSVGGGVLDAAERAYLKQYESAYYAATSTAERNFYLHWYGEFFLMFIQN